MDAYRLLYTVTGIVMFALMAFMQSYYKKKISELTTDYLKIKGRLSQTEAELRYTKEQLKETRSELDCWKSGKPPKKSCYRHLPF